MSSSVQDASFFDNALLNAKARNGGVYYTRNATNALNLTSSLDQALKIGTLKTNVTQLDVTAQVSQANTENLYAFTLDGDSLKFDITNITNTSGLRSQILDSNGKVIADSSEHASQALQEAYKNLNSSTGLKKLDAGVYYVKVSFDLAQRKSIPQAYQISLYSGTTFKDSYATVAASQVKSTQHVSIDNTMTFSAMSALKYSHEDTHRVLGTADTAINIGWLYENKTALSVTSMLTDMCDEQYYSVTVQKGDTIKFALDNKTNTEGIRVQLMDPTGTFIHADSHGTDAQKKAYEEFTSSAGLDTGRGQYLIKISFEQGANKSNTQDYNFKVYSGDTYTDYYETLVATETADTALLSGSLTNKYSPTVALAAYLEAQASGEGTNIMDILSGL